MFNRHRELSIISREELESYLFLANSNAQPGGDVMAMLYAVQAVCEQRIGSKQFSKTCFNQARNLMLPYFDDYKNIYIGATYLYLANYLTSDGEYKSSTFYSNILQFFANEILEFEQSGQTLTADMRRLKRNIQFFSVVNGMSEMIDKADPLIVAKMLPELVFGATGESDFSNFSGHLVGLLQKDKLTEYFSIINTVCQLVCNYKKAGKTNPQRCEVIDLMCQIVTNGMKLAAVLSVDEYNWDHIIDFSSNITHSTENVYFPVIPSPSISHIALAAQQHLKIYSLMKIGLLHITNYGVDELLGLIRGDLRALNMLKQRFGRVETFYSKILGELESVTNEIPLEMIPNKQIASTDSIMMAEEVLHQQVDSPFTDLISFTREIRQEANKEMKCNIDEELDEFLNSD